MGKKNQDLKEIKEIEKIFKVENRIDRYKEMYSFLYKLSMKEDCEKEITLRVIRNTYNISGMALNIPLIALYTTIMLVMPEALEVFYFKSKYTALVQVGILIALLLFVYKLIEKVSIKTYVSQVMNDVQGDIKHDYKKRNTKK